MGVLFMATLKVDKEVCNGCGICVQTCPQGLIELKSGNYPEMSGEGICIACGHCVASCPSEALDNDRASIIYQLPLNAFPVLDPLTAENFLRSRRSVRNYKSDSISRDTLLKLLNISRYAPSGHNSQGLSYIVIENTQMLRKISSITINWLESLLNANVQWVNNFKSVINDYRNAGVDTILRGAPCLIVATAPKWLGMAQDSAKFSLEYIELYATSLGLGTCWAGFVQLCAQADYKPMLELMKLDESVAVVGSLMAGYPKYNFKRLVERNPLNVSWI